MTTATSSKTRTYDYEALDSAGKRTKGKVEASTDSAAAAALRAQGVTPLKLNEVGRGMQAEIKIPGLGDRVKIKDLAVLARQFATMTSSGLSLLRSLAILEEQTPNQKLATALRDVRRDVESGASLSGALGKQDRIFPRLMIAMVQAGETGGFLDQALDRIAVNFEKDATLRGKIKSALTYPMLVVAFSILMLVAVLIFIVPVFEHMFANLHGKLPLPTQILVDVSHQIWWIMPITVAAIFAAASAFRKKLHDDPAWRLAFDKFKLRLPVFGQLFTKIAISRFARNLGTLLHVGVPVLQALDIVGATTGNAVIAEAMKDVSRSVRDGQTMSAPLERHPIFPSMVTNMMQVGEETGQMSAMLDKVSDFYDNEVEAATEALTAAIEPLMVVVMGGMIGVMVVCLYLPMFTIYQNIQGAS